MKEILYKCMMGVAAMIDVLVILYLISPIDNILKLLLYSVVSYGAAIYVALYMRNKKIEIKAVGAEFYETTG